MRPPADPIGRGRGGARAGREPGMTDPIRAVLDAFPYGLYAIGVADGERRNAFTANWLTQVSADPPLVVVAVESDAPSLELARAGAAFSVTLYDAAQRRDAALLARPSRRAPAKLDDVPHRFHGSGLPLIAGGVAWLVCALERTVEAGDHTLLVGRVTDGGLRGPHDPPSGAAGRDGTDDAGPAEPLTLHRAGFRYG